MSDKVTLPSIREIAGHIKSGSYLPVYFLCGEDTHALEAASKLLIEKIEPQLASEFDRETFNVEKGVSLNQVIDTALSFPFGEGKRLIVLKNFEKSNEKKLLESYAASPADFTVMIILNYGKVTALKSQPVKTLIEKGYIFEAKKPYRDELTNWLVKSAARMKGRISKDNAQVLIDLVGDDKALLETQLRKIIDYMGDNEEITIEAIKTLTSQTREVSIFDLQDAVGAGNKEKALEIGFRLIDAGTDIIPINALLSKYIITIARAMEMKQNNVNSFQASKEIGVGKYYYDKCLQARFMMNHKRLLNASRALLETDLAAKTTGTDHKTLFASLISNLFSK